MGHRHLFNTSQMFETENDPSWSHPQQPYPNLGRASGAAENSSNIYPVENMSMDGAHFASHWNPASRSNGYSSSTHDVEVQYNQLEVSGPSHDTFLSSSGAESFNMVPENYAHHASSSNHGNYSRQTFDGVESGFFDLTMGSGRGPYKRKSPGAPVICENSTSRYHEAGSSSDQSFSSNLWQEKSNIDLCQTPWDYHNVNPNYRGNGLSIGGDSTLRNVRSRAALDLETDLARTHLSSNSLRHSYAMTGSADNFRSPDILGQSSSSSTREWSHTFNSSATQDATVFGHETNNSIIGGSNPSFSLDIGEHHNDFISSRNSIPQNLQGTLTQSVRGVRSSNTQRPPTFRASSSNLHPGHVATSNEGLQLVSESYTSRHLRPFSSAGWRNCDRNGRTRISSERFRSFPDEIGFRDRFTTEGLIIADRSALYGPRNSFDQHGNMRLDVDNMSYEELLSLGERIGNVSTGLSEDLMSKCLTQSIYCSSDEVQEEGICVICLEEYKNMDDVGTLKSCSHDFHVGCIRKWLSMKNLCPICKASALPDHMKEK